MSYGAGLNRGGQTVYHPGEFKLWFQEKRQAISCPRINTDIRSQAIYSSSCPYWLNSRDPQAETSFVASIPAQGTVWASQGAGAELLEFREVAVGAEGAARAASP